MKNFKHGSEGNVISHFEQARRSAERARHRVVGVLCAALLVGVVGGCDNKIDPVFTVPGTGAVEGQVFLDADRDGRYDPSGGDRLLTNVKVRVLDRGTTSVLAGATAVTDASGRFTIASVPVGSHELVIDTVGVGAGVAFCQNPVPLTVFLNETRFQDIAARGGCIITIAEAEQSTTGKGVTIRGTVTSSPGQIVAGRMYVQDETGGIRVDQANLGGQTLVVGNVVEIAGSFSLNAGEAVLTSAKLNEKGPGVVAAIPIVTTTKAITAAGLATTDPLNGELVIVKNAKVTQIFNNGTGSSRNAYINDGSGSTILRIDTGVIFVTGTVADLVVALSAITSLNKCYDITGIVANFNGLGELFPRTLADIKEVTCL
ncbi:MAG: hypothetical protein ABIS27_13155 [Longimicrobiales bacterium]